LSPGPTATIARLVEPATKVRETRDRTTLLRVVTDESGKVAQKEKQPRDLRL
jgi:hypothetical protein